MSDADRHIRIYWHPLGWTWQLCEGEHDVLDQGYRYRESPEEVQADVEYVKRVICTAPVRIDKARKTRKDRK